MKKVNFIKKLCLILILSMLVCSLTGCTELDYRKAIDLYNRGNYDAAIDAFHALGDFEDSQELFTRSHYWAAMTRMEAGNYSEALPRFLKLGDFEDSAARAIECKYQMAVAAFEAGNYQDAQNYFQDVADYKQSPEYIRQLNWQSLHDQIRETGNEAGGCYVLSSQQNACTVNVFVDSAAPGNIFLAITCEEGTTFLYQNELKLSLPQNRINALYTAYSSFAFDLNGSTIGSRQTAAGSLDITTCTPETTLSIETFFMEVDDNLGKHTTSENPADCLMTDTMAEHFTTLLTAVPQMLEEAGITTTLQDIGFDALA